MCDFLYPNDAGDTGRGEFVCIERIEGARVDRITLVPRNLGSKDFHFSF